MVEITLPIVLQIIQTVSLVIGIIYYLTIMRNQQNTRELALKAQEEVEKARQRELIMQRSQTYNVEYQKAWSEVMNMSDWEDAEDWAKKYGQKANPEANSKWMYIMRVYGLGGIHLQEGADPDLLFKLYPLSAIIPLWEQFEPIIMVMRERLNDPRMWEPLEYLYNEAKKRAPELTDFDWLTVE